MTITPCGLDIKLALVTNSIKLENKAPHDSMMLESYLITAHNKILQLKKHSIFSEVELAFDKAAVKEKLWKVFMSMVRQMAPLRAE